MDIAEDLDASGLLCPLPVLKARKRLSMLKAGELLRLHTDDPAAVVDVPHFCRESGHEMVRMATEGDGHVFVIRKV